MSARGFRIRKLFETHRRQALVRLQEERRQANIRRAGALRATRRLEAGLKHQDERWSRLRRSDKVRQPKFWGIIR